MLVKNSTRDDAEAGVKELLKREGYKVITIASQTINRKLPNPIFKFQVFTGERVSKEMKCPKCGKEMVYTFDPFGKVSPRWVCNNCGYTTL